MASKDEAKKQYKHYVPQAKMVPEWYKSFKFVLVTSMNQLDSIFRDSNWTQQKSFISFDTETTGLNFEELDIVGYSFCIDGISTYYVPVNHYNYEFNLGEPSCKYIYDRMCEARQVFMYNARYDERVFEFMGYKQRPDLVGKRFRFVNYDMSKVNVYDVMNSVFLADTNQKLPSLKWASTHFLGFDQMHFEEVIEEAGNFYYLNPSENFDTVYYAAADALCTFLLVPATISYYKESKMAGQLDNAVIYPLMHCEHEKIWLDGDRLNSMYESAKRRVDELEAEVYECFGYQFNLNSPSQVSQALERLGVDTGERTASGNMKTGMDELENLPDEIKERFPALKAFVDYKVMNKLLTTYFKVYLEEYNKNGYVRGSYKLHQVPTGRLAAGKDGKNSFFSPVNLQAIPKPHVMMYDVFDTGDRNLFSKKDNTILGYHFVPAKYDSDKKHIIPEDSTYIGWAEGMNPEFNVRSCLTGKWDRDSNDDDFCYVAADYAAQELRITANLSNEPVWRDAFLEGRDVHKSTACALWGEENYNKDLRKRAKGVNFGVIYGMGAQSLIDPKYGINTLADAEAFYNQYKNALPTLFQWIDRKQRQGKRDGSVYTYFGRPRRVKGYFDSRQIGFANRTITNTSVQGTASDILKLVFIRLWGRLLNNPEYKDDVRFLITIHDEIGYSVRTSRLNEIMGKIEESQTVTLPGWQVPIITEASAGWSVGGLFAFEKCEDSSSPGGYWYRPKLD